MEEKRLPIPHLMIVIGCAVSLVFLFYQAKASGMEAWGMTSAVAIIVVLIGVIGELWLKIAQIKMDFSRSVKEKYFSSELKPDVSDINESLEEIKSDILRNILPNVIQIPVLRDDLELLVEDLKFQKRMKAEAFMDPINEENTL